MRTRPRVVVLVGLIAAAALASATSARAEPSATDRAVAQSLFDEGRKLMDEQKYAEACARFARSQKLDPGAGTMLNIALCHEREGKLATAWTEFNEALSEAKRDHREDREVLAREHVDALGPRVPRALFRVEDTSAELELRLDDAQLARSAWEAPVPVDPGEHVLSASAPGRKRWSARVRLAQGQSLTITVPVLEQVPPEGERATPGAEPSGGHATLGWVLVGAGAVAAAAGATSGALALGAKSESDRLCPASTCDDPEAVSLSKDAVALGWGANIGIGVGLVAIAVGTYLVLTAKPDTARAPSSAALLFAPALRGGNVALRF